MLLAIDIGNTNLKTALFRAGAMLATRRAATNPRATADEVELVLDGLLRLDGIAPSDLDAIVLVSVVPALTAGIESIAARHATPLLVATAGTVPIAIRVDRPDEVGADRLVNALAAARLHGTPAVVIDFGTATTFDCVSPKAEYLGGVIVPGVQVSLDGLLARAAKLSRIEIAAPPKVVGRNTTHALQSGIVHGYAALVDGLVGKLERELEFPCEVLATGGLARLIAPQTERLKVIDEHLTLEGLRLLHERNSDG
jgi:type III pantothenate kinase